MQRQTAHGGWGSANGRPPAFEAEGEGSNPSPQTYERLSETRVSWTQLGRTSRWVTATVLKTVEREQRLEGSTPSPSA